MEGVNTGSMGASNRHCDAQYQEAQEIFSESTAGEISISCLVLVLGFDLLGELCSPIMLASIEIPRYIN
jgi:hypothetical protein